MEAKCAPSPKCTLLDVVCCVCVCVCVLAHVKTDQKEEGPLGLCPFAVIPVELYTSCSSSSPSPPSLSLSPRAEDKQRSALKLPAASLSIFYFSFLLLLLLLLLQVVTLEKLTAALHHMEERKKKYNRKD